MDFGQKLSKTVKIVTSGCRHRDIGCRHRDIGCRHRDIVSECQNVRTRKSAFVHPCICTFSDRFVIRWSDCAPPGQNVHPRVRMCTHLSESAPTCQNALSQPNKLTFQPKHGLLAKTRTFGLKQRGFWTTKSVISDTKSVISGTKQGFPREGVFPPEEAFGQKTCIFR